MKVSELRAALKGIKGTAEIRIAVPTHGGIILYPRVVIEKDDKLKMYKLKVKEIF